MGNFNKMRLQSVTSKQRDDDFLDLNMFFLYNDGKEDRILEFTSIVDAPSFNLSIENNIGADATICFKCVKDKSTRTFYALKAKDV